jgi:hypothetical protein
MLRRKGAKGNDGATYVCHRYFGGTVTFIPSGRAYPINAQRAEISSSKVREIMATALPSQLYQKLEGLVVNRALLVQILGLQKYLPKHAVVKRTKVKAPSKLEDMHPEDKYRALHRGRGWDLIVNVGQKIFD